MTSERFDLTEHSLPLIEHRVNRNFPQIFIHPFLFILIVGDSFIYAISNPSKISRNVLGILLVKLVLGQLMIYILNDKELAIGGDS